MTPATILRTIEAWPPASDSNWLYRGSFWTAGAAWAPRKGSNRAFPQDSGYFYLLHSLSPSTLNALVSMLLSGRVCIVLLQEVQPARGRLAVG